MSEQVKLSGQEISFRDSAFDPGATEKYCLVGQIDRERIQFSVLDNLTNDFLSFDSWYLRKSESDAQMADQLERIMNEQNWLSGGFKRTDIIVHSEKFTLVPAALFDSSSTREVLAFNCPLSDADVVRQDVLRQCDARLLYGINRKLENSIYRLSASARIRHHLTPLTEKFISLHKNRNQEHVLAHVRQGRFDVVILINGKLQLVNTYQYQAPEDFIYFLLFACEQVKLNPESFFLTVAGEIEEDSALMRLTKKYIRNVQCAERPEGVRFAEGFSRFPSQYWYNLFALHYFS